MLESNLRRLLSSKSICVASQATPQVPALQQRASCQSAMRQTANGLPGHQAPCCLKGIVHKGEPRAIYRSFAGVETYISQPAAGTENGHILLYFPDLWGMFLNGLLVMDAFADAGYLVLGLDYFRGVRCACLDPITYKEHIREFQTGNMQC